MLRHILSVTARPHNCIRGRFPRLFISSASNTHLTTQARRNFQILYEDDDIIAVNKPAEMLSVPGRGEVALGTGLPRSEEWIASIVATHNIPRVYEKLSPDALDVLKGLVGKLNVPRNERSFKNYLRVGCHVRDSGTQDELWAAISALDEELHKVPVSAMQERDLSVATVLSDQLGVKLYIVHRLDLETTGVLLFAKYPEAAEGLSRQFRHRETEKLYLAEVSGHLTEGAVRDRMAALAREEEAMQCAVSLIAPCGDSAALPCVRVCAPLAPDRTDPPRQIVRFGVADGLPDTTNTDCGGAGKASETLMQVLSLHCKQAAGQGAGTEQRSSMVLLKPITGRSHQLRVHLQFLGHPILHDRLYCPEAVARARAGGDDGVDPAGLLKLHAFRLYFRHPISAAPMSITALCVDGSVNKETSTPFVSIDDLSIDGELLQRGIDVLMQ